MALNKSKQAIIDHRREVVAALRLRGATTRQIEAQLPAQGIVNNKTGKPYTIGIIHKDIKELEKKWQKNALRDMSELKSNQLAEIRAARSKAWGNGDLGMVSKFLKQEIDLLGTESPKRQELTGADGNDIGVSITDWKEKYRANKKQAEENTADTIDIFENE